MESSCSRALGRPHLGTGAAPDVPLSPAPFFAPRLAAMLPPPPSSFPSFLACKEEVTPINTPPRFRLQTDFLARKGFNQSPSLLVDDRSPLLPRCRIQLAPWLSVAPVQAAPISFPRRYRLPPRSTPTNHIQTVPLVLRTTRSANRECCV